MSAEAFAGACKQKRDEIFAAYVDPNGQSYVSIKLKAAQLTDAQRVDITAALNAALTDVFYTMLMALDGAATLGGRQRHYRLVDDEGRTISNGDGDLEAAAYEAFHGGD